MKFGVSEMDKETVKRLADESGLVKSIISPAYMLATDAQLLAFAQACCDWQKEQDAKICESLSPTFIKDGERYLTETGTRLKDVAPHLETTYELELLIEGVAQKLTAQHKCAAAIRNAKESPESDIEEARRTT